MENDNVSLVIGKKEAEELLRGLSDAIEVVGQHAFDLFPDAEEEPEGFEFIVPVRNFYDKLSTLVGVKTP